jgi:hypothetical protein
MFQLRSETLKRGLQNVGTRFIRPPKIRWYQTALCR